MTIELATGDSTCADPLTDAQCLTSEADLILHTLEGSGLDIAYTSGMQGTWIEPNNLFNVALISPSACFGLTFDAGGALIRTNMSYATTIHWKRHGVANWPDSMYTKT